MPAKQTQLSRFMSDLNFTAVRDFHRWTVTHTAEFWEKIIGKLGIIFQQPYSKICDLQNGIESPNWLVDAKMNIAESCLQTAPQNTAIIYLNAHNQLATLTYQQLDQLSNRIANGLVAQQFKPGDRIAIAMPMTAEAVAIYLGIVKMGGVVVSIADSFSSQEIATRLRITQANGIFTQDLTVYSGKTLPLYEKVMAANAPKAIVLPCHSELQATLRPGDMSWNSFLSINDRFKAVACHPMDSCNILFSSGTTADPKAIPWNHTTAIKAASDAYLHHNIQAGDIVAWPTNLGWMMGPWLIFATLINHATLALYNNGPRERGFGEFIQNAKVSVLGVVPTLVAAWRQTGCMQGLDWSAIRAFTSTGECSNPDDMQYLKTLADDKPIIEYCGGTEIGGAYITSTLIEPNLPSVFTTPAFGIDFVILDEGEVALVPPSMGLSVTLLNADHHQIYYANMPKGPQGQTLRRHGDQIKQLPSGYYMVMGRADDTMNLGGIKISSAEIERALVGIKPIAETAAIAISQHGPSQLVIYAATNEPCDKETLKKEMQTRINQQLNPLFKIHDVVVVTDLPKTASNKIMRRVLRDRYAL